MNLPTFNACISGYKNHIFDLQLLAVYGGFYAAYFSGSKPKTLNTVLQELVNEHESLNSNTKSKHADEVDVSAFLETERRFNRLLAAEKEGEKLAK